LVDNMSRIMYKKYKPDKSIFKSAKKLNVSEDVQLALCAEATVAQGIVNIGYGFKNFKNQNMVKGAFYLHKAWKKFSSGLNYLKTMEANGYIVDQKSLGIAELCVGLYNFGASIIPPSFKWMGKIIGLKGDREKALEQIQFCVDCDTSISTEATLILIALKQFFFSEESEAKEMLDEITGQYENSPVMWFFNGMMQRGMGNTDNAISSFHTALDIEGEFPNLLITMRYNLGYCYFLKNRWVEAKEHLEYFLENQTIPNFKPYAAYLLGFAYHKLGEDSKIESYYSQARNWVRPNESFDEIAVKKIDKYFRNGGFTDFEEIFIAANALHEGRFYKKALRLLEKSIPVLQEDKTNRDGYALYYYLKGSILKGLEKTERAKEILNRATANASQLSTDTLYAVPYALCDLAEIEVHLGEFEAASLHLKKARTYKNYDWERIVSYRITSVQQKLTLKKKGASQ